MQRIARSTARRLMHSQVPISKSHGADYQKLLHEFKRPPFLCHGLKFNLGSKYQVPTPDKKYWEIDTPVRADGMQVALKWARYGVSSGIYARKPKRALSVSFSKDIRVFQAKVAAIHHYVREIERCSESGKSVVIFSESQSTLKAISFICADSKLIWDCVGALNEVGTKRKLTLA